MNIGKSNSLLTLLSRGMGSDVSGLQSDEWNEKWNSGSEEDPAHIWQPNVRKASAARNKTDASTEQSSECKYLNKIHYFQIVRLKTIMRPADPSNFNSLNLVLEYCANNLMDFIQINGDKLKLDMI